LVLFENSQFQNIS